MVADFFQVNPTKRLRYFIILPALFGILAFLYQYNFSSSLPPKFRESKYWRLEGKPSLNKPVDNSIRDFTIDISEELLEDLKVRLNRTRFTKSIKGSNFKNGFNSEELKKIVEYWKTEYNWTKHEAELNKYGQHLTRIEGLDVHFVHVEPVRTSKNVVPLLMVNGWPDTLYGFYKLIHELIIPEKNLVFEIIAPSIPGFGFSEEPEKDGFGVQDAARIFVQLMERLKYREFYVHGEDWGSFVGQAISLMYPEKVLGLHVTQFVPNEADTWYHLKILLGYLFPDFFLHNPAKDLKKIAPVSEKVQRFSVNAAFSHLHATQSDTLSAGLMDSPAGLAAYILEQYSRWTNVDNENKPDGGLSQAFTMDELLTTVMIYWIRGNVGSAMRMSKSFIDIYRYFMRIPVPESVPAGLTISTQDLPLFNLPRAIAEDRFLKLIHYVDIPKGGHFGSLEEPQLMAQSIRAFILKCIRLTNA